MGFAFIALFFGLAFFFPILCFGHISASLNPASMIAKLVMGHISVGEFFLYSFAECFGAFVGGITAWIFCIGHFNLTVKQPSEPHWTDTFIKPYQRREGTQATFVSFAGLPNADKVVFRRSSTGGRRSSCGPEEDAAAGGQRRMEPRSATTTVDTHDDFVALESQEVSPRRQEESSSTVPAPVVQLTHVTKPPRTYNMTDTDLMEDMHEYYHDMSAQEWAYMAAVIGDQLAKLSAFATRPSVFNWWQNLLTEALGTMFLVWGAFTGEDIAKVVAGELPVIYQRLLFAFYLSLYIVTCIGALGGPTGYAANPARDFGPRLAHYILPIPNKGSSEWHYAWIPFFGPLIGGLLAAALYQGTSRVMLDGISY